MNEEVQSISPLGQEEVYKLVKMLCSSNECSEPCSKEQKSSLCKVNLEHKDFEGISRGGGGILV